jgi:hypothetical protein
LAAFLEADSTGLQSISPSRLPAHYFSLPLVGTSAVSNYRKINEYSDGKDMEGSCCGFEILSWYIEKD